MSGVALKPRKRIRHEILSLVPLAVVAGALFFAFPFATLGMKRPDNAVEPTGNSSCVYVELTDEEEDLKKRAYHVYLYDEDKKFLGYVGFVPVLRFFASTKKTAFVRLVVEEEKKDKHSWQMFLKHGKHGENITIRDNYIHHNHRGGMTIGVNDMVITRNNFYNNGVAPDKENNLPGFEQKGGNPFMTRYHINMEDSQGHNIQVINNRFEGGRLGVAVRGNDFIVSDNEFINTGISFYRMFHVICRNNKIRGGGISSFPYNKDGGYFRNWYIENNTISNGRSQTLSANVGRELAKPKPAATAKATIDSLMSLDFIDLLCNGCLICEARVI